MSIKAGGGQLTRQRSTERRGAEERVTGRHRLVLREKEKEHGRSSGSSLRSNGSSAASEATATAPGAAAATAPKATAAAATAPKATAAAATAPGAAAATAPGAAAATAPGAAAATAPGATAVAQPPKQRQRGCEAVKPEYDADHSRRAEYLCPRVLRHRGRRGTGLQSSSANHPSSSPVGMNF
ncbi:atherin-like [Gouania willdenowi]|uniref:atherin-like n=1 Tax=Gouania willdenowi TaxID=441366 RepID=UPI001055AA48|nr:atherin-like [Gouania willdenowi]